ncbi:uncharacterized protein LOC130987514 [Salvia miltiorrhiza]|uniref:uncharacterized protein LOC130987514 n=1 Tax=Salvia miltiorrhiza TaxID=226208 RepID=UPI0025ABF205|nr:uncharacterized protein LOC130987514 [Salvia miltiorrhiza]
MAENSGNPPASGHDIILGPDFFGLYKSEIDTLLAEDDSLLPLLRRVSQLSGNLNGVGREKGSTVENNASTSSASMFSDGIGALVSDTKKERLCGLLRQSVIDLTQEVDEMENPVLSVCRIRSCLSCKEKLLSLDASTCKADQPQHAKKKAKVVSASPDLESEHIQLDDDLRFILEQDSSKVEELMESHTREISTTLDHMETKLEEILNSVMTTCRAMTIVEKQELRRLLRKLPATSLDRVVEIIEHTNPPSYSGSTMNVELDKLNNVALWRLYFYAASVTEKLTVNAKKPCRE